ncbi:MAG TPA: hypothetical protein VK421_06370 [Pyrinomonadaceae bacterium]|nr:hypothetical protein [Pyrinomonadaceae bacterium]
MQPPKLNASGRTRARSVVTLLAALSLLACAAAFAQSGRRPPKPQEIAPVPTPTPEPTPLPKDDRVEEKIPLVVMAGEANLFYQTSREIETVQAVAVVRLRESRALEVSAEERRASRGEAVRRAKESKGRHVVWLELRTDPRLETMAQRPPPEYFSIEFSVFQPATAKLLTSGTIPLRRSLGPLGRASLPRCYPVMTYEVEFALGALEAAERIMQSFSLPLPRRCG